jgi:hypothetical protein
VPHPLSASPFLFSVCVHLSLSLCVSLSLSQSHSLSVCLSPFISSLFICSVSPLSLSLSQ